MLLPLTPAERITALNRNLTSAIGTTLDFASTSTTRQWGHFHFNLKAAVEREKAVQAIDMHRELKNCGHLWG